MEKFFAFQNANIMKEIVSLKKILNNETVLQIHVRFMPRIGVVAYNFVNNNDRQDWLIDKKYSHCETENRALHGPWIRDS
jgi:hypothetical protein